MSLEQEIAARHGVGRFEPQSRWPRQHRMTTGEIDALDDSDIEAFVYGPIKRVHRWEHDEKACLAAIELAFRQGLEDGTEYAAVYAATVERIELAFRIAERRGVDVEEATLEWALGVLESRFLRV